MIEGFVLVFEVVSEGYGLLCLRQSVMVGFVLVFEVVSDGGVWVGV